MWETGTGGEIWRAVGKMTECARSVIILGRGVSEYVVILQGVAQGPTFSPTLFKVFVDDTIAAVEAA